MHGYVPATDGRGRARPAHRWRTILVGTVAIVALIAVGLAASVEPMLVAGLTIGLGLRSATRYARRLRSAVAGAWRSLDRTTDPELRRPTATEGEHR